MPPSAPSSPPPPDLNIPSSLKWLALGFAIYIIVLVSFLYFLSWRLSCLARALFDHFVERHRVDLEKFNITECAICQESFEEGEEICVLKKCNHGYHENCIRKWLSNWRTLRCPLCRSFVGDLSEVSRRKPVASVTQVSAS
ncbi:hypothetical protein BT93_I0968 [Corymbia citriodora subsp. variegata]|nr:hypothetical protein BT93_I0968 [Corymbia citriodora subsp. variegata]